MATIELNAPDISCGHCKASIEGDLAAEPGVEAVAVDIEARQVRIDYADAVIDVPTLRAKLAEIGYPTSS